MNFLNVIVKNKNVWEGDRENLFPLDEPILFIPPDKFDMFSLLVRIKAFNSRSQAKKNWKFGKVIPKGFNQFFIGKKKRELYIWNPEPWEEE